MVWLWDGGILTNTWGEGTNVSKKAEKNLIVGLDIGTSKVVAIVGEVTPENEIEVIGIGSHPSRGSGKY